MTMVTTMVSPAELLKKPYPRVVVPEEDGSFRAEIIEFPGCIAIGESRAEALDNLERVAESWLEVAIARGLKIVEPTNESEFSGKLVLRLPKSLHKSSAYAAKRDGVSLNQFIVTALSAYVGMSSAEVKIQPQQHPVPYVMNVTNNLTAQVYQQVVGVLGEGTRLSLNAPPSKGWPSISLATNRPASVVG